MKYIIIFIIVSWLASCFGRSPVKTGLEGKTIPSFNMLLMDSVTRLNTSNIPSGEPIVFLFISPYCPYCQAETEDILSDIKLFSRVRFYILTSFPFTLIKEYADHYHLNKYTNIIVGQNDDSYFVKYFGVTNIPYMAIYDKNKALKQVLIGEVNIKLVEDVVLK